MQVVIPVKDLNSSKSRLAHALPDYARPALMGALLADLLNELSQCKSVTGVSVITHCPKAAAIAHEHGRQALSLAGDRCLNSGVQAAVSLLAEQGQHEAMILHADLPLAEAADIDAVISAHHEAATDVTLVPDRELNGTNGLLLSLPSTLPFCYGPSSWQRHRDACQALGLRVQSVANTALGDDLDMWQDFSRLLAMPALGQRARLACWLAQYSELFDWPLAANL